MKFTLSWLKEHLKTDATLAEITDKLTAVGLEVESVTDPAEALKPFFVAEVIEAKPHPNADRLRVCTVNAGGKTVQVVCGAPNARAGMKGVFAPVGTHIPGTGITLKQAEIRGVLSSGMLCSEREMMLSEEHDGIIDLPADSPIGAPFAEIAGLDDPVIDIAITPNRQDCLGVLGIARDLAAAGLGTLISPVVEQIEGSHPSPVNVEIDAPDACPVFAGRFIRGVKNGPSPDWLQRRLRASGLRPISVLVDITNYLTYDRARPFHVYDAAKLNGDIRVRMAEKGEGLVALDGKSYVLTGSECVIADQSGAIGLGGIIGGETTGASDETKDVFLECALFDPIRTTQTGRLHGIESDARYRFERGVDPESVLSGIEFGTRMILDLCGGEASNVIVAGAVPDDQKTVPFRPGRVAGLGGVDVPEAESIRILSELGFALEKQEAGLYIAAVPSWRMDVDGEADLVEDILRIHGYDKIPSTPLPKAANVAKPTLTLQQKRSRAVRRGLASIGLVEVITYSFMDGAIAGLFGGGQDSLRLANPISSELDVMRPSILPNLIAAAGRNADRGVKSIGLFEVGPHYTDDRENGQALVAAGLRAGITGPRHWAAPPREHDLFDAKSDALATLNSCGAPVGSLQIYDGAPNWYHPGRSATLRLGPKNILAAFGEIHPGILKTLDVKGPVAAFEVYLDLVPEPRGKAGQTRPAPDISDLPGVERDFAFIVDQNIAAGEVLRAAKTADKQFVTDASVFDLFQGTGLPEGSKSLAISVKLTPRNKTFTDEEIEALSKKVISSVEKITGGKLRV